MTRRPRQEGLRHLLLVVPLVFAAALLVAPAPALAGTDVHVDFDKDFDFKTIKTYAWQFDPTFSLEKDNKYIHDRIVEVVDARLYRGGIEKVTKDPDIYVSYRTSTSTNLSLDSGFFGYGYPLGWFWDPYWNSLWATPNMPATGRTYTKGTLLLEAWSTRTKNLIWRGSATAAMSEDYDKMYKKIFNVVGKIADRWHDMRDDQEKAKAKAAAGK